MLRPRNGRRDRVRRFHQLRVGLAVRASPAPGAFTDAKRSAGTTNPSITAASYGSVCATDFILRQRPASAASPRPKAGTPTMSRMKYFTAAPRFPSRRAVQLRSCVGLASPLRRAVLIATYGGSYAADLLPTSTPRLAASSASAPPDDSPTRCARPPASVISASMSSTSRARYGGRVAALAAAAPVVHEDREVRRASSGASLGCRAERPAAQRAVDQDQRPGRCPIARRRSACRLSRQRRRDPLGRAASAGCPPARVPSDPECVMSHVVPDRHPLPRDIVGVIHSWNVFGARARPIFEPFLLALMDDN